jgi:hypothetical protein
MQHPDLDRPNLQSPNPGRIQTWIMVASPLRSARQARPPPTSNFPCRQKNRQPEDWKMYALWAIGTSYQRSFESLC